MNYFIGMVLAMIVVGVTGYFIQQLWPHYGVVLGLGMGTAFAIGFFVDRSSL
jgi:uncharacterized membrane protein YccC